MCAHCCNALNLQQTPGERNQATLELLFGRSQRNKLSLRLCVLVTERYQESRSANRSVNVYMHIACLQKITNQNHCKSN